MNSMASSLIAPGYRFHPTDEELVRFYLKRKITGKPFHIDPIADVDVYKNEPWDLPYKSKMKTRDLEWYFYSALDKRYGNSVRTKRATDRGYWKTTGKDREIKHGGRTVGVKKTLVYHLGRAPNGDRTNWVMHEYKLVDEQLAQAGIVQDALVLCRIFEKSGAGPKNGEKYGAPLIEEEWDNYDVAPLLNTDVAPLLSTGDPASDEALALDPTNFLEMNDLDKELDVAEAIGHADPPPNFYYGECSSHPEHSKELIKEAQKPLEGNVRNSESQSGQLFSIAEQYSVDNYSAKDGDSGELRNNDNALSFDYTFDDLDVFLDAADYPLNDDDGLFLEARDLLNPYEVPTEADPSSTAMLDEYLWGSDDDISKYLSFDSPLAMENENPIPDQGPLLIQQVRAPLTVENENPIIDQGSSRIQQVRDPLTMENKNPIPDQGSLIFQQDKAPLTVENENPIPDQGSLLFQKVKAPLTMENENPIPDQGSLLIHQNEDGKTNDIPMDSKHGFDATSNNEASSKKNQQLLSGDTNPFVKQANKLLASIPAPPAFASEFPPKNVALGLHSAGQSSSSAHVTAGMISITDITVRGNAMDWLVDKNGGLNAIMCTEFSQPDVNSAALMRVSDLLSCKTEFVLSHGWVFLMCFSVLILSMSLKIGSFMYTGK